MAGGKGITDPSPVASAAGEDTHGLNRVTGALRNETDGQGKSEGRHVDEVVGRLLEALNNGQLLDSTHGMQATITRGNELVSVDGVQVLARPIDITVHNATVARHYHTVRQFKATAGGSGACTLTWALPATRYDTLRVLVKRSAAGGAYPTISGTAVTLAGDLSVTASLTGLPAGVYKFSAFVAYDETSSGTEERYSEAAHASVTVT